MMTSLREANIFRLKPLIKNFHAKLSAISENDSHKQILCLVSDENEILLRYVNELGTDALKLVNWFRKSGRVIHDVCFDPSGAWLLVLCFDNTLHIVPALSIVDPLQAVTNAFSTTEITSFVIPFVGPHECPNPKTCPNNGSTTTSSSPLRQVEYSFERVSRNNSVHELNFPNRIAVPMSCENMEPQNVPYAALESVGRGSSTETTSSRNNSKQLKEMEVASFTNQTNTSNNDSVESFMSSSTCPYPICAVWWQTLDKRNRAIIGYSDGSVCFVGLTPNCPFISNTAIENGAVIKLVICRDKNLENVTLLINSSNKEQWKLLLEQKVINYTFPGDASPNSSSQQSECGRDDWQIVMPIKENSDAPLEDDVFAKPGESKDNSSTNSPMHSSQKSQDSSDAQSDMVTGVRSGILPAAKARLASLKDLGAKKFVALKMKLSDNRYKTDQDISDDSLKSFAIMESSAMTPEILTTPAGPYFIVQNLRNTFLLSALHTYSDTLSVHSMDISLIPLFLYKIPKNCQEILICSNILYSVQLIEHAKSKNKTILLEKENCSTSKNDEKTDDGSTEKEESEEVIEKKLANAIGVISSAMASMKNGEEISFNDKALLGLFEFPDETIVNIHRTGTFSHPEAPVTPKEQSTDNLQLREIRSPNTYVRLHKKLENNEFCSQRDIQIMANEFPKINYDPCIVVTNKHTYCIEFNNEPHITFLNAAIAGQWNVCEEFCNTFDLSFAQCIEFAGDCLLRKKKVTQALLTYNVARIPPVRTALKLAMYGENYALMHLCAMALKTSYILKSKYPINSSIKHLLKDHDKRHCENIANAVLKSMQIDRSENVNEGKPCSDFLYGTEESLQMSASSQFHLSNLLLITLTERAVKDKNYMPVWNFLITNSKFHTNMTSIVLCQSGLYSAALLLAMSRGACFDVFIGLVSVANQEFGWYSELNVLLYNISERMFSECIIYLRHVSTDYFNTLQNKLSKVHEGVLERLEQQLNPFSPVFRPIVSQLSPKYATNECRDSKELMDFCRCFIETYLGIIMQLEAVKSKPDNILNALTHFQISYEDNQFAIRSSNFMPISAGCSHCACIVNGCTYFWGSNGISCLYSVSKSTDNPDPPFVVKSLDFLTQLNLEAHAVKCGRQHTLVLTNNGLYAFGSNQVGQLGIGKYMSTALQPMLIEGLDGKNITILEAGQYHNAAVADGHLYTWGWGVYGQHGHGDVENYYEPKIVKFFENKKVIQVSLGHAHSLVLCKTKNGTTEVYAFGSNHYGQVGIGQSRTTNDGKTSTILKCLVPVKLEFSESNIRLIHTKFFSNLAVNEENELFTWGASPQALRLANQNRKRMNAKQKIEESLKKEINRRIELNNEEEMKQNSSNKPTPSPPTGGLFIEVPVIENVKVSGQEKNQRSRMNKSNSSVDLPASNKDKPTETTMRRHSSPSGNDNEMVENSRNLLKRPFNSGRTVNDLRANNKEIEMEVIEKPCVVEILPEKIDDINAIIEAPPEILPVNVENAKPVPADKKNIPEDDSGEHLFPQKVDTSEVAGEIIRVASGLFHYALISSTEVLYTWGKNFEHQLGHDDIRKSYLKPIELDSIENPMYVDCGADFTIVMTTDYVVKAFGGNSNGQCNRELTSLDKTKLPGKLLCLPTTKRFMRLDGQAIENPVDVDLPRPIIAMNTEPTRYMKSVPKFKAKYIIKSSLHSTLEGNRRLSDGNLNEYPTELDDIASSIENISFNDDESLCSAGFRAQNFSSNDASPDEEFESRRLHSDSGDDMDVAINTGCGTNVFRQYIHYCLYLFHGLYDPIRVNEFAHKSIEFRIRTLMLNYNYVEAFTLCLTDCRNAQTSIKVFEYFTKDPSIVPMRRKDLKFFIYQLFIHFITKKFDLVECEKFFLSDLDYYLLELSYVMYFNNNNTELEQNLNRKFRELFIQDLSENQDYKLENTDMIFDNLSVKFKAIVCKKLITVYEN